MFYSECSTYLGSIFWHPVFHMSATISSIRTHLHDGRVWAVLEAVPFHSGAAEAAALIAFARFLAV